jgi:hypothetical protein
MQKQILELALTLLETADRPGTTQVAPFTWPHGDAWKATIFTREQPFLEGEAYENWMAAKERYRREKAKGEES